MTRTLLLDTASLYFRAFFAVPDSVRAPDGTPVNAVRGLLDILAKVVPPARPTHVVACWDDDWRPQWRVDLIPSYKAHRVVEEVPGSPDVEEVPDPLSAQIPLIRAVLDALGVPVIGAAGYEADDVIGTLATRATGAADIVTGDRDLFQLVDDARGVRVISTVRGMANLETVTDAVIRERYGISAAQYADFAVLRGDASDGLPGVKGVGEKTAAALLAAHGDLDAVRAAAARGEGMTKGVAAKILDAAGYLDVAPRVVRVATGLDLPEPAPLRPVSADVHVLGERWGLGAPLERAIAAIDEAARKA